MLGRSCPHAPTAADAGYRTGSGHEVGCKEVLAGPKPIAFQGSDRCPNRRRRRCPRSSGRVAQTDREPQRNSRRQILGTDHQRLSPARLTPCNNWSCLPATRCVAGTIDEGCARLKDLPIWPIQRTHDRALCIGFVTSWSAGRRLIDGAFSLCAGPAASRGIKPATQETQTRNSDSPLYNAGIIVNGWF